MGAFLHLRHDGSLALSGTATTGRLLADMNRGPTAIQVSDVHKSFRMPTHRMETLKERALHPLAAADYTELRALKGVSFEVAAGEFMGIAGRNGSGKTTLLKLLASIYAADGGSIRMAGRVAPFIELGVGFNPNLAAQDNVLLNGVMMGLTPKEARRRFERVIEFAELQEFVELKLKNYSSGMRVRLGFAMLVEADADILLIDEVLAVGDASFQQKCTDTFYRLRNEGRTIVLVTHDMDKLRQYCDRAVLLHEGRVDCVGGPDQVSDRYMELNFKRGGVETATAEEPGHGAGWPARVGDFWFEDESGQPADSFSHGEPIRFCAVIEATDRVERVCFGFVLRNSDGVWICHIRSEEVPGPGVTLEPGERLRLRGRMENRLASGRYFAGIGLTPHRDSNEIVYQRDNAAELVVFGAEAPGGYHGVISPRYEIQAERETARESAPPPLTRSP
jgi:ABC-2 type transport system ATP-binding protein